MNGVVVDVDDVAEAFARLISERFSDRPDDILRIALSGGSTARACYERLAVERLDWSKVEAWFGDERCVPLDDPMSNFRLVDRALLARIAPLCGVHPMAVTDDPIADARSYSEALDDLVLDIVHLGLGPDGHTASLFPDSSALTAAETERVVVNSDPLGNNPLTRLTFTYGQISRASLVVFTVSGDEKADAFRRILDGDPTAPASHVTAPEVLWLVDPAARGALRHR